MSITWEQFRIGMRAWVALLAKQPVCAVIWNGEAIPAADPRIVLSITSDTDLATRYHEDVTEETTTETIEMVRDLTVQCRVETVNQNDLAGAQHLVDSMRARTNMPSCTRVLNDSGIACVKDVTGSRSMNYEASDQIIHAKSFDLFVRFVYAETNVDTAGEWFDKLEFSTTLNTTIESEIFEVPNG